MKAKSSSLVFVLVGAMTYFLSGCQKKTALEIQFDEMPTLTWQSEKKDFALEIRNNSNRDVVVESFISSCNCTSISPESVTIPAEESAFVSACVLLEPVGVEQAGLLRRRIAARIVPLGRGGEALAAPFSLEIPVASPGTRDEYDFDLGAVRVGEVVSKEISITLLPEFVVDRVEVVPPIASASISRRHGHEVCVKAQTLSKAVTGLKRGFVILHFSEEHSVSSKAYRIPLVVRYLSRVDAVPSMLAFGNLRIGEESSTEVVLDLWDEVVLACRAKCENDSFQIVEKRIDDGAAILKIAFSGEKVGVFESHLEVELDGHSATHTHRVALTANVIEL